MNFEFQLNCNDYEEASLANINRTSKLPNRSSILRKQAFLKSVFIIGAGLFIKGVISKDNVLLMVGFFMLFIPVLCNIFVKIDLLDRQIVGPRNNGEPITVKVIREGLALNTCSCQGTFTWKAFKFFIETRNLLVIYPRPSLYPLSDSNFIIPKRAFSDEEQLSDFRELLHKNIGKSRYNYFYKMQAQFLNLIPKSKI